MIHHNNNTKEKKTGQLSQLVEKKDCQNPTPIHDLIKKIKTLNKLGIEGNFLNIVRGINEKPIANIILNSESLTAFLLR